MIDAPLTFIILGTLGPQTSTSKIPFVLFCLCVFVCFEKEKEKEIDWLYVPTLLPRCANETAKLQATLDLPTPKT